MAGRREWSFRGGDDGDDEVEEKEEEDVGCVGGRRKKVSPFGWRCGWLRGVTTVFGATSLAKGVGDDIYLL